MRGACGLWAQMILPPQQHFRLPEVSPREARCPVAAGGEAESSPADSGSQRGAPWAERPSDVGCHLGATPGYGW